MKNILLLFVIISCQVFSQSWQAQTSGTSETLIGVTFTNVNNGTAYGTNGTIIRTTDGGTTWNAISSGTTRHLIGAEFTSQLNGIAFGNGGTTLQTSDGGATWAPLGPITTNDIYDLAFPDPLNGTFVGDPASIFHTTDGGATWNSQLSGLLPPLIGVKFADANRGVVVGYNGVIYRTTDGGANWNHIASGTFNDLYRVTYTLANCWTVVGFNGTILRSTDDGISWFNQTSGSTNQLRDVVFLGPNNGFIVGYSGTILATTDAGNTWLPQTSGTTVDLFSVQFPDIDHASAVGANGTVLTFTNAGPSAPQALAAGAISINSFTANWNPGSGATGYLLDVAADQNFTSLVPGYSNLDVGSVNTYTVNTGLAAGTNYWYRVRAYNLAGTSGNSGTISLITLPDNVTTTPATAIGRYGFTANWNAVTGAAGYYLEVSNNSSFTSPVSGFAYLDVGNVTTANVTGLLPGYDFYYRVKAYNASGTGESANINIVNTLPPSADITFNSAVDIPNPKNLQVLTYTFRITNNGPDSAKSLVIQAAIPRGFKFGNYNTTGGTYDPLTGSWTLTYLANGASEVLTITDTVDYFNQAYDFRDFYEFSVFAKSNADFTGANAGGKVAAGNYLTALGSDFGGLVKVRTVTPDVVIAGHYLIIQSGTIHNGNAVYGTSSNLPNPQVLCPNGSVIHASPIDFISQGNYLDDLSAGLAGYDANGTVTVNAGIALLTGTDIYLNVFNLSGIDFQSASSIRINVPKGSVAIVNVNGAALQFGGNIDIQNNLGNFVLFNFWQASSLALTGSSFDGTVLAPQANVQATGSLFRGQLFANNVTSISAHLNNSFLGYIPLNRTISFYPVLISGFSVDPNTGNNYSPATVVINTTAPYGSTGNGTWTVASVLPVNEMVLSLTRLNPTTILAGTNLGHIYTLDNTGALLDTINRSMTPVAYIHALAVNDSGHIFAASESGLYRSTDGGTTWMTHLPGKEVRAILLGAGGYMYAGTWAFGVYRSADNGYTWVQKNDNTESTVITSMMDRSLTGPQYTVFAGNYGTGMSATYNYANSWFNLSLPYEFVTCMDKTSEGILFAGTLADGVYRSYDNGNTWNKLNGLPDGPIYAIRIDNLNNIFVSSWMFGIYGSADLGDSWSYLGLGGYGVSATFPGPDKKLFAFGPGKVFVNNSPLTSVKQTLSDIPETFSLSQNYPNPFNPSTKISFSLPSEARVTLKVFDILGREVVKIINSELRPAGYYEVNFDASKLTSGVYFYSLQAGNNLITKKMMVIK